MLVDVHAHLDWESFNKDIDKVIERAEENNVVTIITNGINPESNRMTMALAKKYSIVKPALGLYPTDALKLTEEQIQKEMEYIKKARPVAIGEIGLDLHHLKHINDQKKIFEEMVTLATKMKVPMLVHSRNAEEQTIETLESLGAKKVVIHCFTGKQKIAKRAEDNGFFFSIPPIVDHTQQFKDLVKQISMSRLLTETDSPFLSHEKGKRNEPMNVKIVVDNIALIKGLDRNEAEKMLYANYMKLF